MIQLSEKVFEHLFVRINITGKIINFFVDFDAPVSHLQEMVRQHDGIQFSLKLELPLFNDCTNCILL